MKITNKLFALLIALVLVSCNDLSEVNDNPNDSTIANPQQVLTSALGNTAYIVDAQYNNSTGFLWSQYWTWGPGVAIGDAERYVVETDAFEGVWYRSYSTALTDIDYLIDNGNAAFSGVGKVLWAYNFQMLVDNFGSVPYFEAIKGSLADGSNLTPAFDDGAEIYPDLIKKCDEAIADLSKASAGDIGAEDLLFGGDIAKWTQFAKSLKLRLLMRLSTTDSSVAEQIKTTIAAGDFLDTTAEVAFVGTSGDENPMFALMEQGIGLFYVASNSLLNQLNDDPRKELLFNPAENTGTIVGLNQAGIEDEPFTATAADYSYAKEVTYSAAAPVILISSWEVDFYRAEAALLLGSGEDAEQLWRSGIAKNTEYLGGTDEFSTQIAFGSSDADKYRNIAVQKWIASAGLQESQGWIEAKRMDTDGNRMFTGEGGVWMTPVITALPDRVFPASYYFPQAERDLNPNAPAQREITDRLFWDN